MPTADSGMICFNNSEYDKIARKVSWLGINKDTYSRSTDSKSNYKWKYDVEYVGYKYHGNSIMAAIGLVSLKYLDHDNAYRRQLAKWYDESLKNAENIQRIEPAPNCESSRHLYQIRVKSRDELLTTLNESGIFPGVHYLDNTAYRMYSYAQKTCPNAHKASGEILSLPMHIRMTKKDIDYIAEELIKNAK
jgi:dTDP-4-amino-4,6-dideoxygalactose transaminase